MNITVDGEVQEYDDVADFSPVDSSSVWEVCGGADDFGTLDFSAAIKEEFIESCPNGSSLTEDNSSLLAWGSSMQSSMQPMPMPKSSNKRSIRDILREVSVSEETLQCAVARLGGGAQGLQVLMDHVNFWASDSHDGDITARIRKGIVDLGMPASNDGGCVTPNVQWKTYPTRGMNGCEPTHHGAAYTRALRKSHMVRQRGHLTRAHRGHHSLSSRSQCGRQSRGQWRSGAHHQSWLQDLDPELGNGNGKGYEYLFQKELRASDVSSLGRIVLPKKDAERHLPFLIVREGVMITLEDYHSGTFWTVRYRFWPNNKSRMYLLENIGGFVTYHRLQEGDLLLCYRNGHGGYVIRGQKLPRSVKAPVKGLSLKGPQARETTETTEMETISSTAMPPTPQLMYGDQSTTVTSDSNSDLADSSFGSLECTLGELNTDGPELFEGGHVRQQSCVAQQMGYHYSIYEDDVLNAGGFGSPSYKPLVSQDSSVEPVVVMLSVSNVKQRYVDGEETGNAE